MWLQKGGVTMKKNVMAYTALGIVFALFNVLAFVIPTEKTATFWIAYAFIFIYLFYQTKSNVWGLPAYKMIVTLFAMDGYLRPYISTFYIIGEWFLGCIVLIYAIFPILRKCVNKYPKITLGIATVLNLLVLFFMKNAKMPINQNFIVSLYSFLLGMYVIKIKVEGLLFLA